MPPVRPLITQQATFWARFGMSQVDPKATYGDEVEGRQAYRNSVMPALLSNRRIPPRVSLWKATPQWAKLRPGDPGATDERRSAMA